MANLEEKLFNRKETWVLDDVLAKFIMDKKEEKWVEFDILIEWNNFIEFWWFSEPTEEWNTMFIRHTDHNSFCINIPQKEPTLWEIRWILLNFLK